MRLSVPDTIIAELRAIRARQAYTDPVIEQEDAFYLDEGLGPVVYLTADGRVLIDASDWDGRPVSEATDDEAFTGIVVGAHKTGITSLLTLLPPRPSAAPICERCNGERWIPFGVDDSTGKPFDVVCHDCSGRGWRPDAATRTAG